jgi:hypothetical protein
MRSGFKTDNIRRYSLLVDTSLKKLYITATGHQLDIVIIAPRNHLERGRRLYLKVAHINSRNINQAFGSKQEQASVHTLVDHGK